MSASYGSSGDGTGGAPPVSAFSHADEDIITHTVDLDARLAQTTAAHTGCSVEQLYDVRATVERIWNARDARGERVAFRHVALQFPDEMLCDSVPVFWALKKELRRRVQELQREGSSEEIVEPELYILADTSYGKCVY